MHECKRSAYIKCCAYASCLQSEECVGNLECIYFGMHSCSALYCKAIDHIASATQAAAAAVLAAGTASGSALANELDIMQVRMQPLVFKIKCSCLAPGTA